MIKKFLYTSNLRLWRSLRRDMNAVICAYEERSVSQSTRQRTKISFSRQRNGSLYSLSRERASRARW